MMTPITEHASADEMIELSALGSRICIMGPSNSGKSTLAAAISRKTGIPAIHLDQLSHLPYSDWTPRSVAEFLALHEAAIAQPRWLMEGNYSRCVPQRLQRATGMILLDIPTPLSVYRYVRRSFTRGQRHGGLEGGLDSVKWNMLHHILLRSPTNRRRYAALFHQVDLPKIRLASARAVNACYRRWGLDR